jgi:hypothetical protein
MEWSDGEFEINGIVVSGRLNVVVFEDAIV